MRLVVMFIGILIVCISCSDKNKIPEGIMKPSKMQAVLTDILIADAMNGERVIKDTSLKLPVENASYFLKVFQLHQTTRNEFNKSYSFYLKRPDLLKIITDSASAVINRKNTQLTAIPDTIKKKPNGHNFKKITGKSRGQH